VLGVPVPLRDDVLTIRIGETIDQASVGVDDGDGLIGPARPLGRAFTRSITDSAR